MPQMETVLNKPLSGEEVRKIILAKLETVLRGDTRLSDFIAYPSFAFRLELAIMLEGAVHDKVDHTVMGGRGTVDESSPNLSAVTHHIDQSPMTPNEARVDAGLGVPVLTHDEKGRPVEREVKYAKEQVRGAGTGAAGTGKPAKK